MIFTIKSRNRRNTTKIRSFWALVFSEETTPNFYGSFVCAIYLLPFGKVWLSSVRWPPCAKPGNEAECRIYGGWEKWRLIFWRLWAEVHKILKDSVGDPFYSFQRCSPSLYHVSFQKHLLFKLQLSCKVVENAENRWVLHPNFQWERDIPNFGLAFSNHTLNSKRVAGFGWVPFSELWG